MIREVGAAGGVSAAGGGVVDSFDHSIIRFMRSIGGIYNIYIYINIV